jgi:hypothetical protein
MNDQCTIDMEVMSTCYTMLIMLQAREKFLSLRKGTKSDVATVLEEVSCNLYVSLCICIFLSVELS